MDTECLYLTYTACYGAFRDFTKLTFVCVCLCVCVCVFVCVCFSQIFIEKLNFRERFGGIGVIGGMVGLGVMA